MAKSVCTPEMPGVKLVCTSALPGPRFVQRQSRSLVGPVRKCLPAAPSVLDGWGRGWQPGTGQGGSQVSQMYLFAVENHGFGISMCSDRELCSGMRRGLAAEDPGGRTNGSVESCLLLPLCSSVQAGYRDSEFS